MQTGIKKGMPLRIDQSPGAQVLIIEGVLEEFRGGFTGMFEQAQAQGFSEHLAVLTLFLIDLAEAALQVKSGRQQNDEKHGAQSDEQRSLQETVRHAYSPSGGSAVYYSRL